MMVLTLQSEKNVLCEQHRSFNQLSNRPDKPARSCFTRHWKRSLNKDALVYLPALRINKTKHKNLDTLDITEKIAISAP